MIHVKKVQITEHLKHPGAKAPSEFHSTFLLGDEGPEYGGNGEYDEQDKRKLNGTEKTPYEI
jgi:hypothetical protein